MRLLLLVKKMAGASWVDRVVTPTAPANDRFLVAPKVEAANKPLSVRRPMTKLR